MLKTACGSPTNSYKVLQVWYGFWRGLHSGKKTNTKKHALLSPNPCQTHIQTCSQQARKEGVGGKRGPPSLAKHLVPKLAGPVVVRVWGAVYVCKSINHENACCWPAQKKKKTHQNLLPTKRGRSRWHCAFVYLSAGGISSSIRQASSNKCDRVQRISFFRRVSSWSSHDWQWIYVRGHFYFINKTCQKQIKTQDSGIFFFGEWEDPPCPHLWFWRRGGCTIGTCSSPSFLGLHAQMRVRYWFGGTHHYLFCHGVSLKNVRPEGPG